MDDIDAILANAVCDSFHSNFEPDEEHILQALPIFAGMQRRLNGLGALTEEDDRNVRIAIGIIIGHLEHAYPKLKDALRCQEGRA